MQENLLFKGGGFQVNNNEGGIAMYQKKVQYLYNEWVDGGSKRAMDYFDYYVNDRECMYDPDRFIDFLRYLHVERRALTEEEYEQMKQHVLAIDSVEATVT